VRFTKTLLAAAPLAALLAACSSTLIDATVTNGARPAPGVEVSMDCPQVIKAGGPSLFGRTDANGRLEFREPAGGRWIHDGCELVIGTRRIPVKEVCAEYSANHCVRAVVTTDLATEPDGGATR
jgi:hypothetical protein